MWNLIKLYNYKDDSTVEYRFKLNLQWPKEERNFISPQQKNLVRYFKTDRVAQQLLGTVLPLTSPISGTT